MKYYKIIDDLNIPNRWWLGEVSFPDEDDFWKYKSTGKIVNPPNNLFVELKESGRNLNITLADFDLFIIHESAVNIFDIQDIQLVPVSIKEYENIGQYYIMVILFDEA